MQYEISNQELQDSSVVYAEAFLAAYTKTIDEYNSQVLDELVDRRLAFKDYLPLYRKELGATVSIAVFCSNELFWVFFIPYTDTKIRVIANELNNKKYSADWYDKSVAGIPRKAIIAYLGLNAEQIIDDVLIPGSSEPYLIRRGSQIVYDAEAHGSGYAARDANKAYEIMHKQEASVVSQSTKIGDYLPTFFISYQRDDKDVAKELAAILSTIFGSERVWSDDSIYTGEGWWKRIINEISNRDILIFLASDKALQSVYCRAELTEAWRIGKQIMPINCRNATFPSVLSDYQFAPMMHHVTVDALTKILASALHRPKTFPAVSANGIWGTRTIQATKQGIRLELKVPSQREPSGYQNRQLCNTGLLLCRDDEVKITVSGKITIDNGQTYCDAFGRFPNPEQPVHPLIYSSNETYPAANYPSEILPNVNGKGVVGSLIGWIGDDTSTMQNTFVVGTQHLKSITKSDEGFLYLAVNDTRGYYEDNKGDFDVVIELTHISDK